MHIIKFIYISMPSHMAWAFFVFGINYSRLAIGPGIAATFSLVNLLFIKLSLIGLYLEKQINSLVVTVRFPTCIVYTRCDMSIGTEKVREESNMTTP